MYSVIRTKQFDKSLNKILKSGDKNNLEDELYFVIDELKLGRKLPPNYFDHFLQGEYKGYRECHLRGDLLLVYKIYNNVLILELVNIGSHSQLFK
jgi:mRNA interferase YafQ